MLKLPISAICVSKNEGHLLSDCLKSIQFCDEIILIDLESEDSTKTIAEKYATKYVLHKPVSVVEIIHDEFQTKTKHEWILIIDPDERISEALANYFITEFPFIEETTGAFYAPWRFYFKQHLLIGTQWGGVQYRIVLVNRNRFYFTSEVHRGRHLKEGYKIEKMRYDGKNHINHFWMTSYQQLIKKHLRYIQKEAPSRYKANERVTLLDIVTIPFQAFYDSYITKKGYKDQFIGLFLSVFWVWYETSSKIKLYWYLNKMK